MTETADLVSALRRAVGRGGIVVGARATRRYRRGYRGGEGTAIAVLRPASLVALWRALRILAAHDVAIVMQAANTGLTGGSTPDDAIGRPVVVINTMRLDGIRPILDGTQVVCLPGATLHRLEGVVRAIGREPHSVIGSSCFGASVIGGICNNSGGALVKRGPAYTRLALYARIAADGTLSLVNHLGIDLGDAPEEMLRRLEAGDYVATRSDAAASDPDYGDHVRATDAATPARFNADPRRLFEASGSAGRIVVFAVRVDTFAREEPGATFYIGSNAPDELARLRRALLAGARLPVSAEYFHRDAFDIADRYGRDTFHLIRRLGTRRLPALFAAKSRVDGWGERIGIADLSERVLQRLGRLLPDHLPPRLRAWRDRYEHHLILTVDADGLAAAQALLAATFPSASGDVFACTPDEASRATLHRFVTAGAAVRYAAVHARDTAGIVALDVALPRNASAWFGAMPPALEGQVAVVLRYGHFLCHVFHRDYVVARGSDAAALKSALLVALDAEGARYPAEHNVGRQYRADPDLAEFYRALDPTNRFNPGLGRTPTAPGWAEVQGVHHHH